MGLVHKSFNPRAHVGRDWFRPATLPRVAGFNPRAHVGRDDTIGETPVPDSPFQSTRPRGARREDSVHCHLARSFNPRAHVGRDALMLENIIFIFLFQSTRPRGARLAPKELKIVL